MQFEHKGLTCLVQRALSTLSWCGYVQLPKGHPYYGKYYAELEDKLEVHGSVTYADSIRDEGYWIGFDCAHAYDLSPMNYLVGRLTGCDYAVGDDSYKTIKYAIKETKQLAEQLKEVQLNDERTDK